MKFTTERQGSETVLREENEVPWTDSDPLGFEEEEKT